MHLDGRLGGDDIFIWVACFSCTCTVRDHGGGHVTFAHCY